MSRFAAQPEIDQLLAVKDDIIGAKTELRQAIVKLNVLVDQYQDNGDYEAERYAMRMRGAANKALGELDEGHAATMQALLEYLTNGSTIIVAPLGGGRKR